MSHRLGFGGYTSDDLSGGMAQAEFLWAVAEHAPDVLRSLRGDVLPVYIDAYAGVEGRARCPGLFACDHARYRLTYGKRFTLHARVDYLQRWRHVGRAGANAALKATSYPDLIPLQHTLKTWGESWHLDEGWVYDAALPQLDMWRQHPHFADPARGGLEWLFLHVGTWRTHEGPPLTLEHPQWDPGRESRKAYEDTALAAFKSAMKDNLDAVEADVQAMPDFEPTTTLPAFRKHLEWLVRYQVLGGYKMRMAKAAHVTPDSMRDALQDTADLCGLTLRPGRPGAPKD